MDCTPAAIANASRCWCFPENRRRAALIYLLCQWASRISPAPPVLPFSYDPPGSSVNWIDSNGTNSGDLAFFNANADIPSVYSIAMNSAGINSISNLSQLPMLASLQLYDNGLTALDISGNAQLTWLDVGQNSLTTLDVSHNSPLGFLKCDYNPGLTSLDCTGLSALTTLNCDSCGLTSLILTGCTALDSYGSYLTASNNASLTTVVGTGSFSEIGVWTFEEDAVLDTIDLHSVTSINYLNILDCSSITSLLMPSLVTGSINASYSGITSAVYPLYSTGYFQFAGCPLATIDLSGFVNGNLALNSILVSALSLPSMTSSLGIAVSSPNLATINIPVLTTGGDIYLGGDLLTALTLPMLNTLSYAFAASNNPALVTLSFPSLTLSLESISGVNCPMLTTVSFPNLVSTPGSPATSLDIFLFSGCPALTNLNLASWSPSDGVWSPPTVRVVDFTGAALSSAIVNDLLAKCVSGGVKTFDIELGGGSNGPPTGQGILDKATLIAAGNTVVTN